MIELLPSLDTIGNKEYQIIIVSLAYLGCCWFLGMLLLALHNVV